MPQRVLKSSTLNVSAIQRPAKEPMAAARMKTLRRWRRFPATQKMSATPRRTSATQSRLHQPSASHGYVFPASPSEDCGGEVDAGGGGGQDARAGGGGGRDSIRCDAIRSRTRSRSTKRGDDGRGRNSRASARTARQQPRGSRLARVVAPSRAAGSHRAHLGELFGERRHRFRTSGSDERRERRAC